jgi:hypothetical protein
MFSYLTQLTARMAKDQILVCIGVMSLHTELYVIWGAVGYAYVLCSAEHNLGLCLTGCISRLVIYGG